MKQMYLKSKLLVASLLLIMGGACTEQEVALTETQNGLETRSVSSDSDLVVTATELAGITFHGLLEMGATLATNGVAALQDLLEALDVPGDVASTYLRTIKVSVKVPNPDGSDSEIDASGVLVVPVEATDSLRFIISPVPTFTQNSAAPSNIFAGEVPLLYQDFLNYLYFFAINAAQGCAILFPDYPGYGDSYGQCYHPYLVRDPMVSSTITLAQAAQEVLTDNDYLYKREVIVTGYSQGGFVATAVGRELDLNGEAYNLPINLLVSGGTPAYLKTVVDVARTTLDLPLAFVFPYALLGYKENGYSDLDLSELLNSPYDTTCYEYLNGQYSVTECIAYFPLTNIGLFTADVIADNESNASVAYENRIVEENSIEPWVNNAPVIFIHGLLDEAVYYENITGFVADMETLGGTPELHTDLLTEHLATLADYFMEVAAYIAEYK